MVKNIWKWLLLCPAKHKRNISPLLGQLNSDFPPSPKVYVDLIDLYKSSDTMDGEFSTCFTELQRKFVVSRPTKLKDLIRLVKHWYRQVWPFSLQLSGSVHATGSHQVFCGPTLSPMLGAEPLWGPYPLILLVSVVSPSPNP